MRASHIMGTIALLCFSTLCAHEMEKKNDVTLSSETISLPELLSYIEDVTELVIHSDDETSQLAYHELKESLRIVYALHCLHRYEASAILQVLDECYADLIDAIDRDPGKVNILEQSLLLFASGRNYDHETLVVESLQGWTDMAPANELKSAIEITGADLVYVQENVQWDAQKDMFKLAVYSPSLILCNTYSFQNSSPKILIIKNGKSKTEYAGEVAADVQLGGKDHGKASFLLRGQIRDRNGNYANGEISKEQGDDGYNCQIRAGKKKEMK